MIIFIVNPAAGHGRGLKIFNRLKRSAIYKEMESMVYFTEFPNHAEEIAIEISKQKTDKVKAVVVIGGDGTLHEVMNGIDPSILVAFIPGGSGNDFARGCGIVGKPLEILKRVTAKHTKNYWLGKYVIDEKRQRHFVNSIGFGFDAEIADRANRSIYKRVLNKFHIGTLSYVFALIHVLFYFKPFKATLKLDGKVLELDDCWMVTITNHAYYGGGMKIIPDATIQSDYLSVLIVEKISKWKILGLFLTVFSGKHTTFKEVKVFRAKNIIFRPEKEVVHQVDGQTSKGKDGFISKMEHKIQVLGSKIDVDM